MVVVVWFSATVIVWTGATTKVANTLGLRTLDCDLKREAGSQSERESPHHLLRSRPSIPVGVSLWLPNRAATSLGVALPAAVNRFATVDRQQPGFVGRSLGDGHLR